MGIVKELFDKKAEEDIHTAISKAEQQTSGEVRLFVENVCPEKNPLDRAAQLFAQLDMHQTEYRNGVLIYIAFKSKQLAVVGDAGINQLVEDDFWDQVKTQIIDAIKSNAVVDGLVKSIRTVGMTLQQHFPFDQKGPVNELPNDLIIHDN